VRTLFRKPRVLTVAVLSAAVVLGLTACEGDGQSGIPTETPEPAATETVAEPIAEPEPAVTVGDVPGNPAAVAALQAWTDDYVGDGDIIGKCWMHERERAEEMYSEIDALLKAVQQPGVEGPDAVTWSAGGVDLSVSYNDIAAGYACPYVRMAGREDPDRIHTDEEVHHRVRRFVARAVGEPVHPDDTEERAPLVCPAREIWDPWGTGYPSLPPLAVDPDVPDLADLFGDLDTFDVSDSLVEPIGEEYTSVTIPMSEDGAGGDLVVLLMKGATGYCLGAVA